MAIKCPTCHSENPESVKFCGECGTKLGDRAAFTRTLETSIDALTRRTLFAGRYEIIEELGQGGMGRVYRVEDKKIKAEIALKLIRPDISVDKKTIERFGNELKMTRMISQHSSDFDQAAIPKDLARIIAYSQLSIKDDIVRIAFNRTDRIVADINEIVRNILWDPDGVLFVNQGGGEINVILDREKKDGEPKARSLISRLHRQVLEGLKDEEGRPDDRFQEAQNPDPKARGRGDEINRGADESESVDRARGRRSLAFSAHDPAPFFALVSGPFYLFLAIHSTLDKSSGHRLMEYLGRACRIN